jgi:hypothetical protein
MVSISIANGEADVKNNRAARFLAATRNRYGDPKAAKNLLAVAGSAN